MDERGSEFAGQAAVSNDKAMKAIMDYYLRDWGQEAHTVTAV